MNIKKQEGKCKQWYCKRVILGHIFVGLLVVPSVGLEPNLKGSLSVEEGAHQRVVPLLTGVPEAVLVTTEPVGNPKDLTRLEH